jgi:hypothetical protein
MSKSRLGIGAKALFGRARRIENHARLVSRRHFVFGSQCGQRFLHHGGRVNLHGFTFCRLPETIPQPTPPSVSMRQTVLSS